MAKGLSRSTSCYVHGGKLESYIQLLEPRCCRSSHDPCRSSANRLYCMRGESPALYLQASPLNVRAANSPAARYRRVTAEVGRPEPSDRCIVGSQQKLLRCRPRLKTPKLRLARIRLPFQTVSPIADAYGRDPPRSCAQIISMTMFPMDALVTLAPTGWAGCEIRSESGKTGCGNTCVSFGLVDMDLHQTYACERSF